MQKIPAVRIIQASESDREKTNKILTVLKEIGIPCKVSTASCHWHTGAGFEEFILGLEEDLIAYIGGMQFAAPGITETINKVNGNYQKIVLAIPTDKVAKHANEDLPKGTVVFMAGFNSISLNHSLINSALGIAKLWTWRYHEFHPALHHYYKNMREKKPLIKEIELVDGLIPEPKK